MHSIYEYQEGGMSITVFDVLRQHREAVAHRQYVEQIQAKARPEQVRQHPSHPEYRRPDPARMPNPFAQPLPEQRPSEIKNVAEELKKQKPNKDYLELFEE